MSLKFHKAMLLAGIAFLLLWQSFFIVYETRKAIVFQFGQLVKVHEQPGLKFKIPLVQDVVFYDRRLQGYNLPPMEVTAGDQKRIVVNLYARYLIQDVTTFFKKIGVGDPSAIETRLSAVVSSSMRTVLGRFPMITLLSEKRGDIMSQIHEDVRIALKEFGVDVHDVRIVKADLPKENSEAVYKRMESDRIRIAKRIRAEGEEQAAKIRADAERQKVVILAEAKKESSILRGNGLAKATQNYAKAFSEDPKFFEFYRSLRAYNQALDGENTTMILSPEHEFFTYFNYYGK